MNDVHTPVMLCEVLQALAPAPTRLIVDGTFGGGGHTEALLHAGATVIGLDRDPEAVRQGISRLGYWLNRQRENSVQLQIINANFRSLGRVLQEHAIPTIDGLLLDLGVSSMQLNRDERGFSFQRNGPLDMRMEKGVGPSAADLVNTASEDELAYIIHHFGDESPRTARYISNAIVKHRERSALTSTEELATLIEHCVGRHGDKHPATRVFQALRIAANDEMGALAAILNVAPNILKPRSRIALISFHSLEDRLIKSFFSSTTRNVYRLSSREKRGNSQPLFKTVTHNYIEPTGYEQQINPRARSAKLRVYERL
jgi:16S rRNA (cytosine1402-N4)-methyltransferase